MNTPLPAGTPPAAPVSRPRELALCLAAVAAVIWAGWPWSALGDQAVVAHDASFSAVLIDHLQRGGVPWRDAPLAWPLRWGITQGDWMGAQAVLGLLLPLDPAHEHAVMVLAGQAGTGVACGLLARWLVGPGPHRLVAVLVGAVGPYSTEHFAHVNLVHLWPVVLGLLGVLAGAEARRWTWSAAGGALLGAAGHFGFYVGAFALVTAVVAIAASRSVPAAIGAAVTGSTLVPVAWTWAASAAFHDVHLMPGELEAQSVPWWGWLWPDPAVPLHRWLGASMPVVGSGTSTTPGYGVALLAAWGAWTLRRRLDWRWGALIALGVVSCWLALGPRGGLWWLVPGLREPARWLGLAWIAVAMAACAGIAALPRWGAALALLPLLELRDTASAPLSSIAPPAVYEVVATDPTPGALYDVTAVPGPVRLRAALVHSRSLVGGTYARSSPAHMALNKVAMAWPAPHADELLRRIGVGLVLTRREGPGCERVGDHHLCRLLPLPPLPDAVRVGEGRAVGVRLRMRPGLDRVVLTCDGERRESAMAVWTTIAAIRGFPGGLDAVDVFWDGGCDGVLASEPAGETLVGEGTWPRAPLPAGRRHPEIATR